MIYDISIWYSILYHIIYCIYYIICIYYILYTISAYRLLECYPIAIATRTLMSFTYILNNICRLYGHNPIVVYYIVCIGIESYTNNVI